MIVKKENSENITTEFPEPLKFKKKNALKNLKWKYPWIIISEKYNNNKFKYHNGQEKFHVVIPDGFYTLTRLNLR